MPPPQFVEAPAVPDAPAVIHRPQSVPVPIAPVAANSPVAPARVRERTGEIAKRTVTATPPRDFKKAATVAAIAMGLLLVVWATVHLVSSHKTEESEVGLGQPNNSRAGPTSNANEATTPAVPAKPAVSPAETQQESAIALSDKLLASGDFKGALEILQDAEKLNGPLTNEIRNRETAASESMQNDSLAKLRQQEATLWQQATSELDNAEFDAAKRDFRKILALGSGGVRRADAQRYLNDVVATRQKEEDAFRQAQQSSRANDQQGLQRAADLFGQVIAFDGPRKSKPKELKRNVEAKLTSLKQENTNRQIAALEAAGRLSIQQSDFNSARQSAEQIRQAGGDPALLLKEINQASVTRTAQQQREFQQAVQAYNAVGGRDKSGLEQSRSDFVGIVRGNGPRAVA